ncbi:hypothetical protein HMPREF9144_2665 [Prevotella pallens ATCC 700821]|uniref:Uncharacterized protein n=1 Tax=Prevotella pallens ATCC 700821 TaxID=997353 RepID=F9DLX3_9BACT|nr:hypothetical protein HMPREF9144_2665 [Prevotella pallens ATCC 700821]
MFFRSIFAQLQHLKPNIMLLKLLQILFSRCAYHHSILYRQK